MSLSPVISMARKDIRLLVRDRAGFFFTVFFPLIMAIFFGTVFGGGGGSGGGGSAGIPIAVIDEDQTDGSREFLNTLKGASELRITELADREKARVMVQEGSQTAFIVLPKGLGEARARPFWGGPMTLEVGVDPSRKAEAAMLEGLLTKYSFQQLQSAFSDPKQMRRRVRESLASLHANAAESDDAVPPGLTAVFDSFFTNLDTFLSTVEDEPPAPAAEPENTDSSNAAGGGGAVGGWQPIKIKPLDVVRKRRGPTNSYALTFAQGIVWGVIGCCLSFAISLVLERNRGTLIRLRMAPLSAWQVLGGKALACFTVMFGVTAMLMLVAAAPPFNVRPGSVPLLALAIICIAVCFVGIMMLVAAISKTEAAASGLGWGVLMLCSMVGGGMIPLFFLPAWMAKVNAFSPVKWAILALDGAIWRDMTMQQIAPACGILVAIGVVCFAVGARVFAVGKS